MRRAFWVLLLAGCAHPVVSPVPPVAVAVAVAPPACPTCVACSAAPPSPAELPVVVTPADPKEEARVLAALFPKRLKDLSACQKPRASPTSWVQVDELAIRNLESGQFVPVVVRREVGRFERTDDEVRYVIRLDNCEQHDDETITMEAVFAGGSLDPHTSAGPRKPRPIMQRERGPDE